MPTTINVLIVPSQKRSSCYVDAIRIASLRRFRHWRMQRGERCTLILQTIGSVFCLTRCGPCTGQTTSHINQNAGISAYPKLERCRNFHIHPTRENRDGGG